MPAWLIPAIQGVAGLAQTIFGGSKAKKYQRQLERMESPTYNPNQGIMDYYNKALARYNVNPTETALYKRQMQDIDRGVSTGISALQDRRSGVAGASSLLRAANDARLNANVAAEQERNRRFGELGGATQLRAGEERRAFDINQMQPFERRFNLLAMRAGAANQLANTGMSNVFQGLSNLQAALYPDESRSNEGGGGRGGFYNTSYGRRYTNGWPR